MRPQNTQLDTWYPQDLIPTLGDSVDPVPNARKLVNRNHKQNVGKTMPFLPPMTGNGNHTTYNNGDDWGWFMTLFYPESQLMMYPLVN